jgi:hypothetical protein
MLGGERADANSEGMIPRAVKQIFNTAREGGEMKCVGFGGKMLVRVCGRDRVADTRSRLRLWRFTTRASGTSSARCICDAGFEVRLIFCLTLAKDKEASLDIKHERGSQRVYVITPKPRTLFPLLNAAPFHVLMLQLPQLRRRSDDGVG